jgi:hypothetical protein
MPLIGKQKAAQHERIPLKGKGENSMGYIQEEFQEAVGKRWTKVIVLLAILIAIYAIGSLIFGLWPFSSIGGVAKKVTEPEQIIYNYQWFYDQYNAIQAQAANIKVLPEGSQERMGARMVLNNAIGEYNSRSKQITRNLWKAEGLPHQINLEDF